ncbi:RNA polymerase sporulation sigma factor SigK [Anaerotignum sp.]|nr:RNA polymerase sporulation sigma factor SigK [Anaerotignum sp.]
MFLIICIPLLCAFSSSGSFPRPLSKEEEQRLLLQFKNSIDEEKEAAKQELIMHNLRLVAHIAKKYHNPQRDPEELISIGIVGLIKAILSYDNEKSIRLATYASRCIENEILMSLRFSKKFQNDISLHEPIGTDRDGNEIVMLDVINSNTPDFADQLDFSIESQKMLRAVQERLSERERIVVILRYGLWNRDELTQQEIAERLGISRSYVSRIEKKALKKLNAALSE